MRLCCSRDDDHHHSAVTLLLAVVCPKAAGTGTAPSAPSGAQARPSACPSGSRPPATEPRARGGQGTGAPADTGTPLVVAPLVAPLSPAPMVASCIRTRVICYGAGVTKSAQARG